MDAVRLCVKHAYTICSGNLDHVSMIEFAMQLLARTRTEHRQGRFMYYLSFTSSSETRSQKVVANIFTLMWSLGVIICRLGAKDMVKMLDTQPDELVQTLRFNSAKIRFYEGILSQAAAFDGAQIVCPRSANGQLARST